MLSSYQKCEIFIIDTQMDKNKDDTHPTLIRTWPNKKKRKRDKVTKYTLTFVMPPFVLSLPFLYPEP